MDNWKRVGHHSSLHYFATEASKSLCQKAVCDWQHPGLPYGNNPHVCPKCLKLLGENMAENEDVEYVLKMSCGCIYRYLYSPAVTRHILSIRRHDNVYQHEQVIMAADAEKPLLDIQVMFAVNHHCAMRQIMGLESSMPIGGVEKK